MTPLEILKAARVSIEKPENWGKGSRIVDRDLCTCCAAEAIEEASPGLYKERRAAVKSLYSAAGLDWGWGYKLTGLDWGWGYTLTEWNDAPERTHFEVLHAFNLAIALERNMPRSRRARGTP